jgi:tRNA A-37 threonylcarbamoyl transferase component Bud32
VIVQELLAPNDVLRGMAGEYKILNLIGRGGMAAVYRAQRLSDGAIWALKEMRPPADTPPAELEENRKLFAQEAELLRTLRFPNLPVIADYFLHGDRPVLVMEFIPGQTLEDRMRDANAVLLEQQVITYGIQLCRVLNYLHNHNPPIIFRDLKPSNIMLTPDGVLKLIDFGVARTYKARKSKDTIAMGSAGYAPPEQYGKGQTDARSDIYALGATLLHLLTNLPPVPLQTPTPGSISRINPSVDPQTEQVIIKAMALNRDERYASTSEMEQALLAQLEGPYVDPTTRAATPPPVAPLTVLEEERPAKPAPPPSPAPSPLPAVLQPAMAPTLAVGGSPAASPAQAVTQAPPTQVAAEPGGVACPRCGRVNKQGARFCATCGAPLAGPPVARLMVSSPRGTWEMKLDRLPCRIGRRDPRQNHYPELDLAEYDRGIASRHHATIQRDGDFYTLVDLGSTNGTMVNGVLVPPRQPQRLRQGDRIKVGEVEMEFRYA